MAQGKWRGDDRALMPVDGGGDDPAEVERLRAELDAAEARFHSIIERTADGIVIVGPDRTVRFINPAAEAMFGRTGASLLGQDFGLALVAGETTEMDIVRPGVDSPSVAELRVSETVWYGEPAQIVSLRDITDRRQAEERAHRLLLEQTAREQAEHAARRAAYLVEAGAELDRSLDPQATLVTLSRVIVPRLADWCVIDLLEDDRVRRVAGLHSDAAKQPVLEELSRRYPPEGDSPQPTAVVLRTGIAELRRGLDAERIRSMTVDDEHAQLLLQLGVQSAMLVPMHARQRLLGVVSVVCTERDFSAEDLALAGELADRAAQAYENARLYEAAVAANKARSDFLAVVSHELRTPLNAILGYTQLLLGITHDPDDAQTAQLRRIESNALHLLHLIQKILMFASMEAARLEPELGPVTMGELMDGIATVAEPLARDKGLAFAVEVKDRDATLVTDAGKLRQIALDLLTNAVKFTGSGRVAVKVWVEDGHLSLEVSDTGSGIAHANLGRIFEPFWQAEDSLTRHTGGTGLGLTLSRRLARMLGGDITVASEPGAGSRFTLRVPAQAARN